MLTDAHLRALNENPSAPVRADVARAVAVELARSSLTATEAKIAEEILAILARDVELIVRRALAEHVAESPLLPRGIALTLAQDLDDAVALPVLERSPLLEDDDLVTFVRSGAASRWLAIARRPLVAAPVADALVDTGDGAVARALLGNPGADPSERGLLEIASRCRRDESLATVLVERAMLPLSVCEALIATVSSTLRERMMERHHFPRPLAEELLRRAREGALARLIGADAGAASERLAFRLAARGWLTPTFLLRLLCVGDISMVEAGLARLAGVALDNARRLIWDRGPGGLAAIYQKAGLPKPLFPAFRIAVTAVLDGVLTEGRAAFAAHVAEALPRAYRDVAPGPLDQILAQLGREAVEPAV